MVWNYPGALFLAAGGYHHHLGTNTWAAGQPAAGDGDARLLEWEVQVPTVADAHAALANLEAAGHAVDARRGRRDGRKIRGEPRSGCGRRTSQR